MGCRGSGSFIAAASLQAVVNNRFGASSDLKANQTLRDAGHKASKQRRRDTGAERRVFL